jgi:hypothetical protein
MMKFPTEWKVIKAMFQTTNQKNVFGDCNQPTVGYSHGGLPSARIQNPPEPDSFDDAMIANLSSRCNVRPQR